MTTIPASAIAQLEQLRRLSMIASATSDKLKPEVDHERQQVARLTISLGDLRCRYGEVTVGPDGSAYIARTRKITRNSSSGHKVETYETTDEPRLDLNYFTLPIFAAQRRLNTAREQQAEASARAGALRQVVDEAKQALRARGWTESR